jgi:hypothetical protein
MTVVQTTGDPWGVLEYEVKMFDATYKIFFTQVGRAIPDIPTLPQ